MALICHLNVNVSIITPAGAPRVADDPSWLSLRTFFDCPANQHDDVVKNKSAAQAARSVEDSRFVPLESAMVRPNPQLKWTSLKGFDIYLRVVRGTPHCFCFWLGDSRSSIIRIASGIASLNIIKWCFGVNQALKSSECGITDHPFIEMSVRIGALAAILPRIAIHEMLFRELHQSCIWECKIVSRLHKSSVTECPAGAALALVNNVAHSVNLLPV